MADFRILQGTDGGIAWPILNADKTEFDLTGCTVVAQIRTVNGRLLHTFSTITGNVVFLGNQIVLKWSSAETIPWVWSFGVFQIEMTTADGSITRIDTGSVELIPEGVV